ncbi:MAG TPA: AMP-binding protein, partial [Ilumatobacteraceae bacterium]|nr:AMP-binding protein [Ilumatobacteraceae bacterium]
MSRHSINDLNAAVNGLTAPKRFLDLVAALGSSTAVRTMTDAGDWQQWSYDEVLDRAARAATGLRERGVQPGDRVLMMMRNRPDFHWFDIALQFLRATSVSIYNSSSVEEIAYLGSHAGARVAIIESGAFLDRVLAARGQLPELESIFVVGDTPTDGGTVEAADTLLDNEPADMGALAAATAPKDIATMIYTSGTTGPPKAVMINQYNVVFTVESLRLAMDSPEHNPMRSISYLPMAHIAERMVGLYMPMVLGVNVATCPEIGELSTYLTAVRPQMMFGVPRVWEKIYNSVNAALAADPDKLRQFNEAVDAALVIKQAERDGTITEEQRQTWDFLDAVAFAQVRQLIGLDEMQLAISGAAPIQQRVLEWFCAIGVPFTEVYGLSETSGPLTWTATDNRPGWVGPA